MNLDLLVCETPYTYGEVAERWVVAIWRLTYLVSKRLDRLGVSLS